MTGSFSDLGNCRFALYLVCCSRKPIELLCFLYIRAHMHVNTNMNSANTKKRQHIVILSGAGISAESGLQTFRDSDGLWEGYAIEDVATPGAWRRNPAQVLGFYNYRRRQVLAAAPNNAHFELAFWEQYADVTIITQNIDDLHERAGSTRVLHLHGEILKMRSERQVTPLYEIRDAIRIGDRAPDGAQFRPHVVWFEEPVPMMETAISVVQEADCFVVVGTSLMVYPAAGLIQYARISVPKFIVDKKIPQLDAELNFTTFPFAATIGLPMVTHQLKELFNWS